ncbi:undecaprenyl-diphosphate phosphatase [Cellulosilyticum lentocellum]|uniref:Undecaprenyl-diphosphatase n=1 Tax=Cellulosilyticum lentocellum (strain ATCC 49066 / DSM 5427 / NCIMB 11756 / RHM5) TaxID=642492 RepID=F2JML6_CELLD|nr:undecaprenyl-diphosphate phosphatase [Cellulosilyticum lentocellum]ADZ84667.1 Bacitracin resistance protein BacA [Cellulosilyticum lentocellum DSM 5427]
MSIFEAIIQGVLQGITEFLPVSSSGHLALFQHFSEVEAESSGFIMALLHLGTLVAIFVAFRETIWALIKEALSMLKDIFTLKFTLKQMNDERKMIVMLIVATLPLVILYPFKWVYDSIVAKGGLLLLGLCFLYTSAILFISDRRDNGKKTVREMSYGNALFIGLFQGIALFPGISRSGSTIGSSLIAGFSKDFAVKFSFILGIPAILGGCLVEIKEAMETSVPVEILPMVIGFVVAAIVGYLSIKMIDWLVKTDKYKVFAYYTLVVGIITLGINFLG